MTIEEKAKRYDEAMKAAIVAHKDEDRHLKAALERIFPELNESEDERIRKRIIHALRGDVLDIEETNKAIAWLEKQGEKKYIDELTPQEAMDIAVAKCFDQGEQKPYGQRQECVDCQFNYAGECKGSCAMKRNEQKPTIFIPKFRVGDIVKDPFNDVYHIVEIEDDSYRTDNGRFILFKNEDAYSLVEQKPVEWSEEDEKMFRSLHNAIYVILDCAVDSNKKKELSDFLGSLKNRVQSQSKQEWSKEDKKCIRLSTDIIDSALRAGFCVQLDRDRCVDWLKSLRPQNTWKPSDEQIRAFEWAYKSSKIEEGSQYDIDCKDLLEQLKAL